MLMSNESVANDIINTFTWNVLVIEGDVDEMRHRLLWDEGDVVESTTSGSHVGFHR